MRVNIGKRTYTNAEGKEICVAENKICLSKREAGSQVNDARRSNRRHRGYPPCGIYLCSECGMYHLTHYRLTTKSSKKSYNRGGKLKEVYAKGFDEEELKLL